MIYISLSDCKHGFLYKIYSRNLTFGVFNKNNEGFIGIRLKFDTEYLFTEYHWDRGIAMPIECLEECPIIDLDEINQFDEINQPLFEWLKQKEKEYCER